MKKCPFCAEEIQDEAIKCRFCNTFLSAAPPSSGSATASARPADPGDDKSHAPPFARAVGTAGSHAGGAKADAPTSGKREMLYEGNPSWKAFFGHYLAAGFLTLLIIAIALRVESTAETMMKFLVIIIPLGAAAVFLFGLHLYRKSIKFRVSSSVIEHERGVLSKRIDVVQLWRVKDVVYKQSLVDRMLGIAHIQVVTSDATNPSFDIVGMPASRQLFENLRDSIEIQRQAKNVYGVVS